MNRTLEQALVRSLETVSFPTLGHFLEHGFADSRIRAQVANVKIVGRAVTLKLTSPDAIAVNRALAKLVKGDVLVIDMNGDHAHAPVGAVTACAALVAGAKAIVVDGVVTDVLELRETGLPVFARGTSLLTTKRLDAGDAVFNEPVQCGGVFVRPGDLVLADDNGVLFLDAGTASEVIEEALASDRAEPALLARLRAGEPLRDVLSFAASAEHSHD
ncbi:diguanylate cyclase [Caballeronia arationis]|jgi:regulator of RNase E activity RraA|uniref:Putative 4-hydroxy-4-methyl-2-oxoglutarate aldolase n=1 Tax=Caballeronia arationis TaxID=1777142 RepID=A0A7Z7I1S5_9BURK|nr:RraA family protein [Caballeronia arationis]SAL07387.1 diguanylate cyclase [Caballeronia arationis]SOE53378.1 Regulator of RNase E activity RraA [Caballeronia arationis]